jgi:hypothetical protein
MCQSDRLEKVALACWWLAHGEAMPVEMVKKIAPEVLEVLDLQERDGMVFAPLEARPRILYQNGYRKISLTASCVFHLVRCGELCTTDVAREAGISRPTVYRVLATISRVLPIYVDQVGRGKRWKVLE